MLENELFQKQKLKIIEQFDIMISNKGGFIVKFSLSTNLYQLLSRHRDEKIEPIIKKLLKVYRLQGRLALKTFLAHLANKLASCGNQSDTAGSL